MFTKTEYMITAKCESRLKLFPMPVLENTTTHLLIPGIDSRLFKPMLTGLTIVIASSHRVFYTWYELPRPAVISIEQHVNTDELNAQLDSL